MSNNPEHPHTSPQGNTLGAFDWTHAKFIPDSISQGMPGWLRVLLHILAILVLLGLPLLITLLLIRNTGKYYPLFADAPPANPNLAMEVIRWCTLLASMYVTYGFSLLVLNAIMWILNRASSKVIDRDEPPQSVGHLITGVMGLRTYIAFVISSAALTLMSFLLFPLSLDEKTKLESVKVVLSIVEMPLQYKITRGCLVVLIFAAILLAEKFVVQRIAVMFHYHSAAGRIQDNNFQLKCTRKLKRSLIETRRLSSGKIIDSTPESLGGSLFDAICPTGSEVISANDLRGYLPDSDVEKYFEMLDPEAHGDLKRSEFSSAVKHFFEEREALSRTVTDQTRIINKVDRLLLVFFVFIWIIAAMIVLNVSATTALATVGSAGVAFTFVFSSAARTAFESIVFVIFTHPFDVGDKVLIKNEIYVVKELGLWASTFYGPGRRITYITNSVLRTQMIVNVRRSPLQNEAINIKIHPLTPFDRLQALENRLNEFIKANTRDYVPPIMLKSYRFIDKDHMAIEMTLSHRANFQNGELKDLRTKNFMLFLKEAVAECGIEFAPSY